ncbi:DUF2325 domain-containing protein [Nitrosomonas sp. GH22]|nr:DUF2325 domain-containing protein [Nitrosomonas sp. GH22]
MTASQPLLPGQASLFSEMELIMKFLEKTALASVGQDAQPNFSKLPEIHRSKAVFTTFSYQDKQQAPRLGWRLKHLYHLICSALSRTAHGNTVRLQPENPAYTKTPIDCHVNTNTLKTPVDASLHWIRSGQPHPYLVTPAISCPKDGCCHLIDQSVLCIGGRAALYPDYHRLIEAAGGHFMAFRSSVQGNANCLLALLDCVNIVICPADCINHEDFFTVRRYCQRTRKYCVMLQRSDLVTFGKAVEILSRGSRYLNKPGSSHLPAT